MTIDNEGCIWLAWEDGRWSEENRRKDIYVQKFTADVDPDRHGDPNFLFDSAEGKAVSRADGDQRSPSIVHDARNGVWLSWEDSRGGFWSDVYNLHLTSDGEPALNNAENGNLVCDAFHNQINPAIGLLRGDGSTGAVVLWGDRRASSKEEVANLFIQKVDDYNLGAPRDSKPEIQTGYELEAVYPNPFNNIAALTFATPSSRPISIAVYDISGRLVKSLTSGTWEAGRHRLILNAEGLAAGSYVIRLTTEEGSIERMAQLVK